MLIWKNKTSNLQIKKMRGRINIWFSFYKGEGLLINDWHIKEHFILEKLMQIQNKTKHTASVRFLKNLLEEQRSFLPWISEVIHY